ncbi:peroxiredoxin [Candidatus Pacearchaeota archaeon]|nr:peroxiredoxin [Candidatus Pacearchaeota archaeon]
MAELKIGDKAPQFKELKKYKDKTLVLYFYPRDNTPGCTKEACSFRDEFKILKKKGIEVLGVSPDSEESHEKFKDKFKLPFELVSDPDKILAKKYGVWVEKMNFGKKYFGIKRTTFIIEKNKIKQIIKTVDTKDSANQVLKKLGLFA